MFHQLTKENISEIAKNMMETVKKRVSALGVTLAVEDSAIDILADVGFDPVYGARPLRRAIQSKVEDLLAEKLLDGTVKEGDEAVVYGEDGKIEIKTA